MSEIFSTPTVKEVIFQIQFSNLLFLDKKIGDYQLKIMEEFPESSEIIQKQLMFAVIDNNNIKKQSANEENEAFQKIWQFNSEKGYTLDISSNSLSIVSRLHKTYNNEAGDHKFRDVIKSSVSAFLEKDIAPISVIKRIGLRYVDECPLPELLSNDSYSNYYNTSLAFNRFDISKAKDMQFVTNIEKENDIYLRYFESYKEQKLTIDFDAYKFDIKAENYLDVTDKLYEIVHEEWENTIKEPVKEFMRQPKEI
ncbi:MAG: TIGR04255 family protein [bacterium]